MKQLNFAIVGCGVIAFTHAKSLESLREKDCVLYGACDIIPEKADAFAAEHHVPHVYYDHHGVMADPAVDVVCVCVPSGTHGEICKAAAEAGKAIVCEKPMEITPERIDDVIRTVERTHAKMQCIFQRRMMPAAIAVRQAIRDGKFGRICLAGADLRYYRDQAYYDSAGWRGTWEQDGGGALMNQGVHGIDLILWMLGEPVKTVYGCAGTLARRTGVDDTAAAVLTMASGAVCVIKNTTLAYPEFPTGFVIHGEKGTIAFDDLGVREWTFLDPASAPPRPEESPEFSQKAPISLKPYYGNMHAYLLQDLADAVAEDREPMIPPREAITAVRAICDITRSAALGRAVEF